MSHTHVPAFFHAAGGRGVGGRPGDTIPAMDPYKGFGKGAGEREGEPASSTDNEGNAHE